MKRIATALAVLLALAGSARAAPAARGTVLQVDGEDIYVDVGIDHGVGPGSKLVLLHAVVATHPVTQEKIRDTFPLGSLKVVNAGRSVSVAHVDTVDLQRVAVGDEVELHGSPRAFVDPWEERTRPRGTQAREEVLTMRRAQSAAAREKLREQAEVRVAAEVAARETWEHTLGQPTEARIDLWKAYTEAFPASPYLTAVHAEIDSLRAQLERERAAERGEVDVGAMRGELERLLAAAGFALPPENLLIVPPTRVYQGTPFELAFHWLPAYELEGAWIYYRRAGAETYRRAPLKDGGDGYWRQRVPGQVAHPPHVEYFVEILPAGDSEPRAAFGSQQAPMRVAVDASVEDPPAETEGRTRLTMVFDYVDFDGPGRRFDEYTQAEVDVMYRFYRPIYALRLGFGALGGRGGPKDLIDEGMCDEPGPDNPCRRVSFHYSYLELEHRFSELVAVMLRPMAGSAWRDPRMDPDEDDRVFFESFGVRARLRLGEEKGTNVVVGAQVIEKFGSAFEGAFTWDVIPRFPVVISAVVTDQPVPQDFGVRLIADVGYRGVRWVYPSVRVSYQARDVDHAGFGGGVALNFDW